jgi:histidinol-phosphate aminotransferase
MSVLDLARPDIRTLQPYEHAKWDPSLERLHANELPWRAAGDVSSAGLNRYPEPQPAKLVTRLAELYAVDRSRLLACRGSDEAIDLLVRAFCRAGVDSVVVTPPTFGMYGVAARIQGADTEAVPLRAPTFDLDAAAVLDACRRNVKIVFLCTPNNPTGNRLSEAEVMQVIEGTAGRAIVVLDEAYVEFARAPSLARLLPRWPHLVVLRTLSKAYGLAGARCGAVLADPDVIALLRRILPPYAIAQPTVEAVARLLGPAQLAAAAAHISALRAERDRIADALTANPRVARLWPSEANFLLCTLRDVEHALGCARAAGLMLRDMRHHTVLGDAIRITVGTPDQNDRLLEALQ